MLGLYLAFANCLIAAGPVEPDLSLMKGPDLLLGSWEVVFYETAGVRTIDPPGTTIWTFTREEVFLFPDKPACKSKLRYSVEDSRWPGKMEFGDHPAIYTLDGDMLKICFSSKATIGYSGGQDRPKVFDGKDDSRVYCVFRRKP